MAVNIHRFSVWTGATSLASAETIARDVKACIDIGMQTVSLMVNDHSRARSPRSFDTYSKSAIRQFCKLARDAGLEVRLTSWCMPHEQYIRQAAEQLLPLLKDTGAQALEWDLEEPWTQANVPMDYTSAAALIYQLFAGVRQGASGIGFVSEEKFGPMAANADYLVPQIYVTKDQLDPDTGVETIAQRWRSLFGQKTMVVGLAAYDQEGIPGHSVESALRTSFQHTDELGYVERVSYWSLYHIRTDATVRNTIRDLIKVPVSISASVGQGGVNKAEDTLIVQSLLLNKGFDPGPIDGIVGTKTITAIKNFQRSIGQTNPDGRVDPNGPTFKALVS